jgi:hypothetical protein
VQSVRVVETVLVSHIHGVASALVAQYRRFAGDPGKGQNAGRAGIETFVEQKIVRYDGWDRIHALLLQFLDDLVLCARVKSYTGTLHDSRQPAVAGAAKKQDQLNEIDRERSGQDSDRDIHSPRLWSPQRYAKERKTRERYSPIHEHSGTPTAP